MLGRFTRVTLTPALSHGETEFLIPQEWDYPHSNLLKERPVEEDES